MKSNNLNKLILFNLFCFFILFCLLEMYSYRCLFCEDNEFFPDYKKFEKIKNEFVVGNHLYVNYKKPSKDEPIYYTNNGREFVGEKYKKNSILLLGDSYTYGLGLKKEDTFGSLLSKYTKRPVFTWAFCTEGIEYSVLQLKNEINISKLKKQSENNPLDYVIYTYTYTQPQRIVQPQRQYRFFYLRKYNLIPNQKMSRFDNLYSVLLLKNKLFIKNLHSDNYEEIILALMKNYLKAIKKDVNKNFPKAKFVFLIYSDDINSIKSLKNYYNENDKYFLDTKYWKDLEKDDIIVLSTEELIGRKMMTKDILNNEKTVTIHPNADAWKKIVPKLVKTLDL